MPSTSVLADTCHPGLDRALAHDRAGSQRVDHAGARGVEAAEDQRLVDERNELLDLGGRDQRHRLDRPRTSPRPSRRCSSCIRSSVRATSIPPLSMNTPELLVLAHALERQLRHLLGVVDREDEVRGVPGRAAGVRAAGPCRSASMSVAEPGQVVGQAVADDAGADHDDPARSGCRSAHTPTDISDGVHGVGVGREATRESTIAGPIAANRRSRVRWRPRHSKTSRPSPPIRSRGISTALSAANVPREPGRAAIGTFSTARVPTNGTAGACKRPAAASPGERGMFAPWGRSGAHPGRRGPRVGRSRAPLPHLRAAWSAWRSSLTPNAPSSRATITPCLLIANSHGSVCRWKAFICGRRPLLGWLPT